MKTYRLFSLSLAIALSVTALSAQTTSRSQGTTTSSSTTSSRSSSTTSSSSSNDDKKAGTTSSRGASCGSQSSTSATTSSRSSSSSSATTTSRSSSSNDDKKSSSTTTSRSSNQQNSAKKEAEERKPITSSTQKTEPVTPVQPSEQKPSEKPGYNPPVNNHPQPQPQPGYHGGNTHFTPAPPAGYGYKGKPKYVLVPTPVPVPPPAPTYDHESIFSTHVSTLGVAAGIDNADFDSAVIAVGDFDCTYGIPQTYGLSLKNELLTAISREGRYKIMSATLTNARALGARFYIGGQVSEIRRHAYLSGKHLRFETEITVSISGYDLYAGQNLQTRINTLVGYGYTEAEADEDAITDYRWSLGSYLDNNFRFITTINSFGKINANGAVKSCVINNGTNMGIRKNEVFQVYAGNYVGGQWFYKRIGRIKATRNINATLAECKVTYGAKQIGANWIAGAEILVLSGPEVVF